jgi:hypothetical protein
MSDVYNIDTKRWISFKRAIAKGLLTNTIIDPTSFTSQFRLPKNAHIFAIPDKRSKTGSRYVLETTNREISYLKRTKKATLIYPAQQSGDTITYDIQNINPKWRPYLDSYDPPLFYTLLRPMVGKRVEVQFLYGNELLIATDVDLSRVGDSDTSYHDWWNSKGQFIFTVSAVLQERYAEKIPMATQLKSVAYNTISPSKASIFRTQQFRDGDVHCILHPMETYFQKLYDDAILEQKSKKTLENLRGYIRKAQSLAKKYEGGIPENEMAGVADSFRSIIIMVDPLMNVIASYGNTKTSITKRFRFLNSRFNHGELLTIELTAEPTAITHEEGYEIIKKCLENKEFCKYTGTITNPTTVHTTSTHYAVLNPAYDVMTEFNKSFDHGIKINSIKEPELAAFLIEGSNLVINWKNTSRNKELEATEEIDLIKGYTQFKSAPNYIGFPSVIAHFRQTTPDHDVVRFPGVYQVDIVSIPKSVSSYPLQKQRALTLIRQLGFSHGIHTLTSPWIMLLKQYGLKINILMGAWGKRMDFTFPEEMLEKDDGISRYALWTGLNLHLADSCFYKMACDSKTAQMYAESVSNGAMVRYCSSTSTALITEPKTYHGIMPHISAFIVSYTQLNVFQECLKYDMSEIVATKLDSIVLNCPPRDISPMFRNQREKYTEEDWSPTMAEYCSNVIFKTVEPRHNAYKPWEYLNDEFLAGVGGAGKTYGILTNLGYRRLVFATTAWKLITSCMIDYNVQGASLNQLRGKDTFNKDIRSYKDLYGSPGIIILDEMSMIDADIINTLREMYPHSYFLYIGDYEDGIYYQSTISPNLYRPESYRIIEGDRRSKDQATKDFKNELRELRRKHPNNIVPHILFMLDRLPYMTLPQVKEAYKVPDIVLTGTKKACSAWTEYLMSDNNHHLVMKHDFGDPFRKMTDPNVRLHGEILTEPTPNTEVRNAFTIHSFQGETIKEPTKLFIDIENIMNPADIYTAVSRVQSISQIVLTQKIKTVS